MNQGQHAAITESSPEDLALQRHLLDLALQPLDRFDGFDRIEQIGPSALRYQLSFITYALCMAQLTRTPAFTGYLAEAARNAILKMTDKRVWGYWFAENLIGYGRSDPDPIRRHNVMYTGFFGAMLGIYETLNDDRSLSAPGALTLRWSGTKTFSYDFGRVAEAIADNMRAKPGYPQYACEPHLVYPMCNAYAINTLIMHDRLHGTGLTGDLVDQLRTSYHRDGWIRESGRWLGGGTRKGLAIFPPYLSNDAAVTHWLNAAMPDVALATWEVLRRSHVQLNPSGEIRLRRAGHDRIDVGNYGLFKGDAYARSALMLAAREMGDETAAAALGRSLEERHPALERDGARRLRGVSTWTSGTYVLARFSRRNAARDMVLGNVPQEWRTGPILSEAPYPGVLVAKAVTDGRQLELVLHPGQSSGRRVIELGRLVPGQRYAVSGAVETELHASAEGTSRISVHLAGRTEVLVKPTGLTPTPDGRIESVGGVLH